MYKQLGLVLCAALALSACGREEASSESATLPGGTKTDGVQPGTAAVAPADPSVPNSAVVGSTSSAPSTAGQDSPSNSPDGTMTKQEESQSMPQPGQPNSHSTTARDAKHGTGTN
ncbi:MAG TPA: hypothetical protein VJU83_02505 [Burkholderiales bacterium]|nr:hypothetical protein [Burkholderiales bacterium]